MRYHQLPTGVVPDTVNFSDLPDFFDDVYGSDKQMNDLMSDIDKELFIVHSLKKLISDKEKALFLLLILREYGFKIDYNSMAESLGVKRRWLQRVQIRMRKNILAT